MTLLIAAASPAGCIQAHLADQDDGGAASADASALGGSGGAGGSGGPGGTGGAKDAAADTKADAKADTKADTAKLDAAAPVDTGPSPDPTFVNVYDMVLRSCRGCHTNGDAAGGFNYALTMPEVYAKFMTMSACNGMLFVEPGDPSKSVLSLILRSQIPGCLRGPMPQGSTGLANDKINGGTQRAALIDAWIKDGAKPPP